jgi:hypothetical protein
MFVEMDFNITWKYQNENCFKALSSEVTGTENKIHATQSTTVNAKEVYCSEIATWITENFK